MREEREPAMQEPERLIPGQENSKHRGPGQELLGAFWEASMRGAA